MGAQGDAEQLKEHPFFKAIDWKALALKQVTPPFKPSVESDESVANFDPEFTSADVRDAGPEEIKDLDEEDPSEDWVALTHSVSVTTMHMPNGPLGSDKPVSPGIATAPVAPAPAVVPAPAPAVSAPAGIDIQIKRKKKREPAGSPLTSSVQENFRGFTYHGESVMPLAAGMLADARGGMDDAVMSTQEEEEVNTDDELADERPAGRYARRRDDDEDHLDGFDEDLH